MSDDEFRRKLSADECTGLKRLLFAAVVQAASPNDPTGHLPNCGYTDAHRDCDCAAFGERLDAAISALLAAHPVASPAGQDEGAAGQADLSTYLVGYLMHETDVTRPQFHATKLAHLIPLWAAESDHPAPAVDEEATAGASPTHLETMRAAEAITLREGRRLEQEVNADEPR